jgi:ribonuclease E
LDQEPVDEPVDELVKSTQPAEDVEEPRRRRRRSSAPSSN